VIGLAVFTAVDAGLPAFDHHLVWAVVRYRPVVSHIPGGPCLRG